MYANICQLQFSGNVVRRKRKLAAIVLAALAVSWSADVIELTARHLQPCGKDCFDSSRSPVDFRLPVGFMLPVGFRLPVDFRLPVGSKCPVGAALAAEDRLRELFVSEGGANVTVEVLGKFDAGDGALKRYISDAVRAVISFYGRFPIKSILVKIQATDDNSVGFGSTTHDDDGDFGLIEIDIGRHTAPSELDRSWTLTHEMMHLAFPVMPRNRLWLAEGIATYAEPIARLRTSKVTAQNLWSEFYDNSWRALPARGEGGLNSARSLSRIYWGGALFCLIADMRIRQKTANKLGLQDALRAIADKGGTAASRWTAEDALAIGDRAIGGRILRDLYLEMAERPAQIDLVRLWKELGVSKVRGQCMLNDRAPLAHIRRAIEKN